MKKIKKIKTKNELKIYERKIANYKLKNYYHHHLYLITVINLAEFKKIRLNWESWNRIANITKRHLAQRRQK